MLYYLCVIKTKAREPKDIPHQSRLGNSSNQCEIPRQSLAGQWRAPDFRQKIALMPGGLQRTASTQILSYRSFIASFGVALTKAGRES